MIGSYTGSGLGFGLTFTLQDRFSREAARIQGSMDELEQASERLSRGINSNLGRIRTGMSLVAGGVALLLPAIRGLNNAGWLEQQEIAFSTMLRSAEQGRRALQELTQFAEVTPFSDTDIIELGRLLVAFGVRAQDLTSTLTTLGNVAAGVSVPMSDLVEIYGRNLQQTQLYTRDINQLTNRGIPITQALAQLRNVDVSAIPDMVTRGLIGIDDMVEAFRLLGSETGQFANLMQRQSDSWLGTVQRGTSYITQIFRGWGEAIMTQARSILNAMVNILQQVRDFVQSPLGQRILQIATALGVLSLALGVVLVAVGGFRYGVIRLARLFPDAESAVILATVAARGYAAGLRTMATATLSAFFPAVRLLGVLTAIVGIGSYLGVFQRLATVFNGMFQTFRTWNGQSFVIDQDTINTATEQGMLENMIALATWTVRVRELFSGFITTVRNWLVTMRDFFTSLLDRIPVLGTFISRNLSDINKWQNAGVTIARAFIAYVTIAGARFIWFFAIQTAGWIRTQILATRALFSISAASRTLWIRLFAIGALVAVAIRAWRDWGVSGRFLAVGLGIVAAALTVIQIRSAWLFLTVNGGLVRLVARLGVVIGLVALAVYAWNNWGDAGRVAAVVIGVLTGALVALRIAQWAANIAAYANPYVLLAIAIVLLIAQIVILITYWEEITTWFRNADWEQRKFLLGFGLLIYGIVALGAYWDDLKAIVTDFWDTTSQALQDGMNGVNQFITIMTVLPVRSFLMGVNFIQAFFDGMRSIWGNIVTWLTERITSLVSTLKNGVNSALTFFGLDPVFGVESGQENNIQSPAYERTDYADVQSARTQATIAANRTPNYSLNPVFNPVVQTSVEIDGNVLARAVNEINAMTEARGGTLNNSSVW